MIPVYDEKGNRLELQKDRIINADGWWARPKDVLTVLRAGVLRGGDGYALEPVPGRSLRIWNSGRELPLNVGAFFYTASGCLYLRLGCSVFCESNIWVIQYWANKYGVTKRKLATRRKK